MQIKSDKILDATGLSCPMPIISAKKAIDDLLSGEVLEIHVTDKGAKSDIPAWAKAGGHELLSENEAGNVLKFWIRKA